MLAYAASRPVPLDRRPHPNTMLLIIGAHVALVAAVMSAKMDLPIKAPPVITHIEFIPVPPDPPQHPIRTPQPVPTTNSWIDTPRPHVPTKFDLPPIDRGPALDPGTIAGAGTTVTTEIPRPPVTIAKSGPQLLTPPAELKPPYPASKLLNEEEAVLTVRLTIDENGRVIAVDPVGRADHAFLDAARRHLLAHWRYKPATEDGHAIPSSATVTLHFELDG
jgi:periplasmic protein TonB